ncbi:MAG: AAA family ATPase [Patescibacteria group bacterium]|nr:MAG: AAA family ATPase [Patescibacteria group bacterium]
MGLKTFRVVNNKSIRLAEATEVPAVMVIAGPNGVGKSTLLYAIKQGANTTDGNTRIFYQPPHRVLRATKVRRGWLSGGLRSLADLISGNDVSGYEGLSFHNSARTPGNVDEAGSTIKHTLGKIENRRQAIIAGVVDAKQRHGETIDPATLPRIYEPLENLTKYLLPHLVFDRIDFADEENIRCIWARKDASGTIEVDIDDMSSGEKSIIVLFLPLLEDAIRENLEKLETIGSGSTPAARAPEDRVFLVDEPEQHLHPDLQSKLLAYVRNQAATARTQFVLTTHSPTILDQTFDNELYLLSNPSADPEENQLKRIASSLERLEALKQLAGSTYFLTTGRALVCIEGETAPPDEPSDLRLLQIFYPRATAYTLVPVGGKGNVINTVTRLREHVPEDVYRIRVRGLVDADQSLGSTPGVFQLPVCMIENFLLDPEILQQYLLSIEVNTFADEAALSKELVVIATSMKNSEIARRVRQKLKTRTVRLNGATVAEVKEAHRSAVAEIQALLPNDTDLGRYVLDATEVVDGILAEGKATDRFHGKAMLKEFYQRHIASKNIGYGVACLELAKMVGAKRVAAERLDPVFEQLAA